MDTQHLVTFLETLNINNNKVWFDAHRSEYENLRNEFAELLEDVIEHAAGEFDVALAGLNAKRCLFRINRDTRFSANKEPYKTNFAALLPIQTGMSVRAGYYVNIDAEGDLVTGAGVHGLEPNDLSRFRQYVGNHHEGLTAILIQTACCGSGGLAGERQKTVPRAFAPDHPAAEYLKHKSFIVARTESALDVPGNMIEHIVERLRCVQPFVEFLRGAMG